MKNKFQLVFFNNTTSTQKFNVSMTFCVQKHVYVFIFYEYFKTDSDYF